jgi:hypothetical protein
VLAGGATPSLRYFYFEETGSRGADLPLFPFLYKCIVPHDSRLIELLPNVIHIADMLEACVRIPGCGRVASIDGLDVNWFDAVPRPIRHPALPRMPRKRICTPSKRPEESISAACASARRLDSRPASRLSSRKAASISSTTRLESTLRSLPRMPGKRICTLSKRPDESISRPAAAGGAHSVSEQAAVSSGSLSPS